MVRMIIAVLLLIVVIISGVWLQAFITDKSQDIASGIPLSISQDTAATLEISYAEFRKFSPLFSTLFIHSTLDEITDSFEKSFALIGINNPEEYTAEAYHLQFLLNSFSRVGAPSIESIF